MPHNDEDEINAALRGDYNETSGGTRWFVGIIIALALVAIGYLVFSA